MAFATYTVDELSEDLMIEESVQAYAESHMGIQRHNRLMQAVPRVRLGLQVSPENFFYNAGQWTGAPYVNLNALEFTMSTGTAEVGVYDAFVTGDGVELFSVVDGVLNTAVPPTVDAGDETAFLKLAVNPNLIEQVEVRDGDTYEICVAGTPTPTTVRQVHLSLKSSNKPDFTFYQWHPQAKYRFNRNCNVIADAAAPEATTPEVWTAAYMGDNNYVLSEELMEDVIAVVTNF